MSRKIVFIISVLILIISTSSVIAYPDTLLERPQFGYDINDATTGDTLFTIDEQGPYPSGTENINFLSLKNQYDEPISVTITLSNDNWEYNDGSQTKTIPISTYAEENIMIDTTGPTRTCSETDNRRTYSYTYSVTSNSLTIYETTNDVQICAPGGGNGNGNGNGNSNPN